MIGLVALPATEQLHRLRILWRPSYDSTGYAHPALIYAACRLLEPPPKSWKARNLWGVFYNPDELDGRIPPDFEIQGIFQKGYDLYTRMKKEEMVKR